ncbi:hypothetical protein ACFLZH_02595 [Patescibacteria group bacterium]
MNKKEFLQSEIKHILDILKLFPPEENEQYLEAASKLNEEELVKVLKILYKVEQEYFELIQKDTHHMEDLLQSLKPAHE